MTITMFASVADSAQPLDIQPILTVVACVMVSLDIFLATAGVAIAAYEFASFHCIMNGGASSYHRALFRQLSDYSRSLTAQLHHFWALHVSRMITPVSRSPIATAFKDARSKDIVRCVSFCNSLFGVRGLERLSARLAPNVIAVVLTMKGCYRLFFSALAAPFRRLYLLVAHGSNLRGSGPGCLRHRGAVKLALFAAFTLTLACGPSPEPNVPPSPYLPNGEIASCPGMCDHLTALGCEEAKPTTEGETCEEICAGAFAQGSGARLPLACIQQAPSCAAAEAC